MSGKGGTYSGRRLRLMPDAPDHPLRPHVGPDVHPLQPHVVVVAGALFESFFQSF